MNGARRLPAIFTDYPRIAMHAHTLACLELAQRCCAVAAPVSVGAQLNQIIGTLVRLVAA